MKNEELRMKNHGKQEFWFSFFILHSHFFILTSSFSIL